MSAFSPIGTNTSIGGRDYCLVGGFAYPGRCADTTVPEVPIVTVPFGNYGLPVDPSIQTQLEQPATGPQVVPPAVEVPVQDPTDAVDAEQARAASVLDRLASAKRAQESSTLPTPENPWFLWWLVGAAAVWAAWRLSR